MQNILQKTSRIEDLKVLLIGNNPMEMGNILDKLNRIRSKKIITEIAFDLKTITERLAHFRPSCILIDDNIGKLELTQIVTSFCSSNRTKNVPITVLKNSNYQESFVSFCNLDYVLKQNWSAESLLIALKNSLKFRRTQISLLKAYNNRRRMLLKLSR
jgi:PleD family two-component response regulator